MTELEQRLSKALEIQKEIFIEELTHVTKIYQEQMHKQDSIIQRQMAILNQYESISGNWQISLDESQLRSWEEKSKERLTQLQNSLEQYKIDTHSFEEALKSNNTQAKSLEMELSTQKETIQSFIEEFNTFKQKLALLEAKL